ncbi:MAG: S41 family peptidase [Phycisphaerales bacterium]
MLMAQSSTTKLTRGMNLRAIAVTAAFLGGLGAIGAQTRAEPPRVVWAAPDLADVGVDPALTEIRVKFDQDMSPLGRSICGGGTSMPTLSGKPHWIDARTLAIPVSLKPSMLYSFSINCPAARNFRSAAGESAVPYPIAFRTRAEGEAAPKALTPEETRPKIEALRLAVTERYSHVDKLPADFEKQLANATPTLEAATTPAMFARRVRDLLRPTRDGHLWIRVNDITLGVREGSAIPNADPKRLAKILKNAGEFEGVTTAKLADGIAYIAFDDWARRNGDWLAPAFEFLDGLDAATPLVVDVRLNGGGDEGLARSVAARFVEEQFVYAKSLIRNPEAKDGYDGPFERVVEPAGKRHTGPVAVLIGQVCVSSNESFILMMQKAGLRETFGETTGGSSGNPKPHELGHGVTLFLPSWRDLTRDGREIEDHGIEPDHAVAWPGAEQSGDPVLDAAIAWLKGKASGASH